MSTKRKENRERKEVEKTVCTHVIGRIVPDPSDPRRSCSRGRIITSYRARDALLSPFSSPRLSLSTVPRADVDSRFLVVRLAPRNSHCSPEHGRYSECTVGRESIRDARTEKLQLERLCCHLYRELFRHCRRLQWATVVGITLTAFEENLAIQTAITIGVKKLRDVSKDSVASDVCQS